METAGLTSDFLGVTKGTGEHTDWAGYSRFFQDDEIVLNKIDNIIFKVFDRIFYQAPFPTKAFLVVFAIMHVQALYGNTFFSNDAFYNTIVKIFEITKTDEMSPAQFNEFGYSFFGLTLLMWIFFISISIVLFKQKYINTIPLVITSVLIFIINPLLLNPTTYLIKRLIILLLMISSYRKNPENPVHINFLKYYPNEDFVHYCDDITNTDRNLLILLLVFLIIALILQIVMILLSFRLLSVTPYIPYHGFTGLSMTCVFYQTFLRPVIRLLESFFGFYPRWSTIVLYASNIVLYFLLLYFVFLYPVIHTVSMSLMIGYSIGGVVGSVLKLAYAQTLYGMNYLQFMFIIISYVVASLVSFLVLQFHLKRKYMPLLAYNGEVNIVDTPNDKRSSLLNLSTMERDELLRSRVFEDERLQVIPYAKKISFSFVRIISRLKLLFLVKIGVENGCDLFIDYTLFKFIIITFPEDRDLLKLISIVEMAFPYMRIYFHQILPIIRVDVMKFNQRFLIYEINALNKLTETEVSISSNQELGIIRSSSSKYQETVMNTWLLDQISLSSLENVMSTVNKGDKMFNWIFTKYPNLKEAHNLYYNYAIECKTDFYQAEKTKRQIKRIEDHKLTMKDKSFISFVRTFPVYLTHCLITPNGLLPDFTNNENQYREESDGSIDNLSSMNEPTDYDAKLRYAIYKATHKLRAYSSFYLQIIICIFFFAFIVSEFVMTFTYYSSFNSEMENTDILRFYRHLSANLSLANSYVLLKYGTIYTNTSKNSNNNSSLWDSVLLEANNESVASYRFNFFDYYDNLNISQTYFETSEETLNFNIISRALLTVRSYQLLFNELKHLNLQGLFDFSIVENLMFFTPFEMQLCNKGKKMNPLFLNFPRLIIEHTINQVDISYRQNMLNWLNSSNSFCNIFSTYTPIMKSLKDIRYQTYYIFMKTNRDKRTEIILISIILSVTLSVVYIIVFIIGVCRYKKELRCFAEILSSLDEEAKKNGARPILIQNTINPTSQSNNANSTANNNNISEKNINPIRSSSKKCFYYSLLALCFFSIIVQGVFVFSIGYVSYQMKSYDLTVTYWNYYNKLKIPQYLELFDSLSLSCILRTHPTNATTYLDERAHCFGVIEETEDSDTLLVTTTEDGPSILGVSEKFDDFYLKSTCSYTPTDIVDTLSKKPNLTMINRSKHFRNDDDPFDWLDDQSVMYSDEEFECMSLSNKMLIFIQITRDVLQKLGKDITTYSLNDYIVSRIAYLYYIMNKYLINDINACNNLIIEMGNQYLSDSKRDIILIFIASIIFSVISFFITYYFKNFMDSIYQGGLILARRLVPNEMAANHRLVSFLLNKGLNKKNINKEMSVTQSIVHYSSDMLFYTTNNGIILLTNQAIFQNLSYSPEQIVGKLIYSLFEEDAKKEIQRQIGILEKDPEQGMIHMNVHCITATNTLLYVSLMIFPTTSNHLVLIMKNLTDILDKQKIAQQMRNNCLTLYFSILPTFVAKLLNNDEKDISFLVPTASIMFVDISRFSEFSRPLSPEQLLGILSSIYNQYDAKLREYSTLTKIKIIGDSFMVAGGLFNNQLDYNKSIPSSNSNMSAMAGITHQKSKDPNDKSQKLPGIGGPIGLGFSKSIDIIPPSLSTYSSQGSAGPFTERLHLANSNQPDNQAHPNQDPSVQIYPSFSDIESTLQAQEQFISQSPTARMDSEYMTPDAFVASQAIRFGFDCIEVIEDINMKNNFSLAIKVGISTGGPIVAGVLGDDKLDFEIFGDEISFTSKLQASGIPGKIVIADSTYNLVSNLQYQFEDRDIHLKGKANNIRTHIVNLI